MSPRDKNNEEEKERRNTFQKPSRAVIISALAAGGVFQLNGWQVQAHGNRSSHAVASVSNTVLTPDDYALKQEEATKESTSEGNTNARQLAIVTEQLRNATRLAANTPEVRQLMATRAALEQKVRTAAASRHSQQFLRQGDMDAVVAVIEGQGSAHRVLSDYTWALISVAYLGEGDQLTTAQMENLTTLSKAAMAYTEKALRATPDDRLIKENAAEVYHNVASFTEQGAASTEGLRLGREAAERALALRQQLGQKQETMIAELTVGRHYLRAGQTDKAKSSFETALRLSTELNDLSGIAWSKTNLAKAVQKSNAKAAQALRADARRIAQKAEDPSLQALRVEQRLEESR